MPPSRPIDRIKLDTESELYKHRFDPEWLRKYYNREYHQNEIDKIYSK